MKIFNSDIKILGDDEGFIIFKCPYCKSEFKLSSRDLQDRGDIYFEIFCPYCGLSKEIKHFYTNEIKAKYDYLLVMTDRNKSLNGEAFDFHLGRAKVNDRIQFYLNRVFLPLVHYINDFLIEEMLSLDEEK